MKLRQLNNGVNLHVSLSKIDWQQPETTLHDGEVGTAGLYHLEGERQSSSSQHSCHATQVDMTDWVVQADRGYRQARSLLIPTWVHRTWHGCILRESMAM